MAKTISLAFRTVGAHELNAEEEIRGQKGRTKTRFTNLQALRSA